MGMIVNHNMESMRIYNMYEKNTVGLQDSMYKVSSGKKINFASDDPSGIGIAKRINTRVDSVNRAKSNVQNDQAIIKMADTALTNMADIVSTIREKVVMAGSSSLTSSQRKQLGSDINTLIEQYDNIMKDAKYDGVAFFDSAGDLVKKGFNVQYGADGGNSWQIQFTSLNASVLSLTAANIGTKVGTATLSKVNSSVTAALSKVDSALNKILTEQTKVGTYELRLGYLSDNRTNEATALTELESSITDIDTAKAMTEFMRYNILTQASQTMLAQSGQSASMVLRLLE